VAIHIKIKQITWRGGGRWRRLRQRQWPRQQRQRRMTTTTGRDGHHRMRKGRQHINKTIHNNKIGKR
jgi:hypothetical protein